MKKHISSPLTPLFKSTLLSCVIGVSAVQADDIEVYVTTPVTISPNILFVLDESGSMCTCENQPDAPACVTHSGNCWGWHNAEVNDQNPGQRMHQLKEAMRSLISDSSMDNVRTAILGYRSSSSIILTPHSPFVRVGEGTNRSNLLNNVIGDAHLGGGNAGTLVHSGSTPSSPALKKAMDWYRGLDGSLESPVSNWCEPNYVVFLTDGSPNTNGLTSYAGTDCFTNETDWEDMQGDADDTSGGRCSATIAEWGYGHRPLTSDAWSHGDNDPALKRFRNVITHTIGFHTAADSTREQYLLDIAHRSPDERSSHASYSFTNSYGADLPDYDENDPYAGGQYSRADNADSLITALQSFVDQANRDITYTYTAPSIPFNADNAAISGDEMYVPIFKPSATEFWSGNLKKYKVQYNEGTDSVDILARSDISAIDDTFRFQSSSDFWNNTGSTDGANPLLGGANSNMAPSPSPSPGRNLYTWLDGNEKELALPVNKVHPDNVLITKELMNIATEGGRNNRLNWANWLRNDGVTPRSGANAPHMGAPLHTKPVTVRYSLANDLVLLNTTEGILHAFDGETGSEVWAYMPDELLKTIKKAKRNNDKDLPMYGLDGPMTLYSSNTVYQDLDSDGFPDEDASGDPIIITPGKTFVVVGMRRGGSNYYALDITNREAPEFAWEIIGGTGSGDFGELGQTWSKPIFTKLEREGNDAEEVLIFGGGYDPDQDDATTQVNDDRGNAIYIVNADDGTLISKIYSAEQGTMGNAIAANILTVDINANGITDRLYAADVGGRLIRVDIPDKALAHITSSSDIRATIVADVGGSGGGGDTGFQRFFNTPEVAYYKRGGTQYLALLIASGKRPDPVDTSVTDRFYMVKDTHIWSAPATYPAVVTEDDLYDSTLNLIQDGSDTEILDATSDLLAANGWYINLALGEKGFSEAKVYDFAVLFTTYTGIREEPDICTATSVDGESFLYILDMRHGGARFGVTGDSFHQSDDLDKSDRKVTLDIPGMPPSPTLMFPAGDGGTGPSGWVLALVGLQAPAKWPDHYHPISWEEVIAD